MSDAARPAAAAAAAAGGPRRHAQRGLTLLEILVSLVATMVVLAGLFTIVSAGSKGFIAQSQIAELQINLRFAMERIKSDLRLAAFLGTPDSNADPRVCPKPAPVLQALRILDAADAAPNPSANPFIVTDRLRLLGSFVSSDYYLSDSIVGTTFTLQPLNLPTTAARYAEVFNTGGLLMVRTYDTGNMQILPISASSAAGATVSTTIAPRFTYSGGTCGVTGVRGEGHELSVLNYVNYRLVADATVPAADQKRDLVRELLASDGATPLAAVPVTVGEFIVDFEVAATADTAAVGTEPNIPAAPASSALFDGNGVGDNPASARTVIITLTARTAREDPDFPNIPRTAATDPIRSFDVDPTIPGAARVRTLRVEVPLTNFVLGTR